MGQWTGDYVVDIDYSASMYEWVTPLRMYTQFRLAYSQNAPDPFRPGLQIADLACGMGVHACMLAACYPNARVFACDINPLHVANAIELARDAELTNIDIELASFAEIANRKEDFQRRFDFTFIHGVYSWVKDNIREDLHDFIDFAVAPGGLVYLNYECLPGAAEVGVLNRLYSEIVAQSRIDAGADLGEDNDLLDQLVETGAGYFNRLKTSGSFNGFKKATPNYRLHAFASGEGLPLYSSSVIRRFAANGLAYIGGAEPLHVLGESYIPPALSGLLKRIRDRAARETFYDAMTNYGGRGDIFALGSRPLNKNRLRTWFGQQRFMARMDTIPDPLTIRSPFGALNVQNELSVALHRILRNGPARVHELAQALNLSTNDPKLFNAVRVGYASGIIEAAADEKHVDAATEPVRRFNRVLAERVANGHPTSSLASPVTATASPMTLGDVTAIVLDSSHTPLSDKTVRHGLRQLIKRGGQDPDQVFDGFSEMVRNSVERYVTDGHATRLTRLGVLTPNSISTNG